jgi:hypothetical protein
MKILLCQFLTICFASTMALEASAAVIEPTTTIRGYQYQACGNWLFARDASGFAGYMCASYPANVFVAEATSVKTAMQALEDQVAKLEARIKVLEAKQSNP